MVLGTIQRDRIVATQSCRFVFKQHGRQQLDELDRRPFLLVFDGLERVLTAYARPDAAHLGDQDVEDRALAGADSLPAQLAGRHRLRRTADPRVGLFLKRMAGVRASRVLISTRMYPADLQTETGQPVAGTAVHFLTGLADDDALSLWRAMDVRGSRGELVALFNTFDNYPLLIRALAGEVARYRPAPGDFDAWRGAHSGFDPYSLPLVQRKSHVLAYALEGLGAAEARVLHTIAAFRMPASYETLVALLIGQGKLVADEPALDIVLSELEDRGLVGWDRRANRYDEHPIVRGVAWSMLAPGARRTVYEALAAHFESVPVVVGIDLSSLDDLAPAIELYQALIGLGRKRDALDILQQRLNMQCAMLGAWKELADLAAMLLPLPGEAQEMNSRDRGDLLTTLAVAEHYSGQLTHAYQWYCQAVEQWRQVHNLTGAIAATGLLSISQSLTGKVAFAEREARRALISAWYEVTEDDELAVLQFALGKTLAVRGRLREARTVLGLVATHTSALVGVDIVPSIELARIALWQGQLPLADEHARLAMQVATQYRNQKLRAEALTYLAQAAMRQGDLREPETLLHEALSLARAGRLLTEEIMALLGFAQLHHSRTDPDLARQKLEDVLELAVRGPLRLINAEAFNLLAAIERQAGRLEAAAVAAGVAYQAAWCDGPPFAYQSGLDEARGHLAALGISPPCMPSFKVEEGFEAKRSVAAKEPNPLARQSAMQSIALQWAVHPATVPLLQHLVKHDPDKQVRQAAATMLAAGWPEVVPT